MKHEIFTVYDIKTEAYLPPFYMPTKGAAIRAIMDTLDDPNHQFSKHPEDFTLFHIGTFDDVDANLVSLKVHVPLGTCLELRQTAPTLKEIN